MCSVRKYNCNVIILSVGEVLMLLVAADAIFTSSINIQNTCFISCCYLSFMNDKQLSEKMKVIACTGKFMLIHHDLAIISNNVGRH